MKKLVAVLSIICLLAIIAPCLPAIAQPLRLPHENPATVVTDSLNNVGLLLSYVRINKLASDSRFQSAQDLLNEMADAGFPVDIAYIIIRYNELYKKLFTSFETIEDSLDQAAGLLDRNQIDEAKLIIDTITAALQDSGYSLRDIKIATDSIGEKLNAFQAVTNSPLAQAWSRLSESIARLEALIETYDKLNNSLTEQYNQVTGLAPTGLTLEATPLTAFVGDNITCAGRLRSGDMPLAGRNLYFTIDNVRVGNTATNSDGSYFTYVSVPYNYIDHMTLIAVYEPSGDDTLKYLAANSPPVALDTLFYPTRLKTDMPDTLYVRLPFTINGEVISGDADISRNISVYLDNALIAADIGSGTFRFVVTLSQDSIAGASRVTVTAAPAGRYSGASQSRAVEVKVMPVYLEVNMPSFVLLPGDLRVNGSVTNDFGPVADLSLSLRIENSAATVTTAPDGSFQGFISLHILPQETVLASNPFHVISSPTDSFFDLSPIGIHEITIALETPIPWVDMRIEKIRVLTINPVSATLVLAALAALVLVVHRRAWRQAHAEQEIRPVKAESPPGLFPSPAFKPGLTAITVRVISAYRAVLSIIEKVTGVVMAPHVTLREFPGMVNLSSPDAAEGFAELTTITETALYSPREPPEKTSARAEKLAAAIKEELLNGTP